jgi:hypothetical protein
MNVVFTLFPRLSRSLIRGCRPALVETDFSYRHPAQAVRKFAGQFTRFEWAYLCSYRWFVTALERAAYRGSFTSVKLRARQKLVNEGLRQSLTTTPATIDGRNPVNSGHN